MQMRSVVLAAFLAVVGLQSGALYACGYDNPQSIALGSLNWIYPDALYVRTAVLQAERTGLLPPGNPGAQSGPFAFHRATSAMKSFGAHLADPRLAETSTAISVVLIPQVMWTRFEVGPEGVTVQGHAEGPLDGDVVIVTEEKVVRALVDQKLNSATAEENGLLRFYGNPKHIAKVRTALTSAGQVDQPLPMRSLGTDRAPPMNSSPDFDSLATPATF